MHPELVILASLIEELRPFLERVRVLSEENFYGQNLWWIQDQKGKTHLVVTTGIGKSNTAFTLGALLAFGKPKIIIHGGIGGVYKEAPPKIGDLVVIEKCIMGDEGVLEEDGTKSYLAIGISPLSRHYEYFLVEDREIFKNLKTLFPEGYYRVDENRKRLIKILELQSHEEAFKLWYGSSCSVGLSSGSLNIATRRWDNYGAWVEEMETSSSFLSALRMGVPIIAIRAISNIAGDRNKSNWHISKATLFLGYFLLAILDEQERLWKEKH